MTLARLTAHDLLTALRDRGAPLPYEFGAFIALEACEAAIAHPVLLDAQNVELGADGSIYLSDDAQDCVPLESAHSGVRLLGSLLAASGPGVPPMLLGLVESGPANGLWSLERVRDEIIACLVPLNRGASRRVLTRMLRDVSKPSASARPPANVTRSTAADLSELLGESTQVEEVEAPPVVAKPPAQPVPAPVKSIAPPAPPPSPPAPSAIDEAPAAPSPDPLVSVPVVAAEPEPPPPRAPEPAPEPVIEQTAVQDLVPLAPADSSVMTAPRTGARHAPGYLPPAEVDRDIPSTRDVPLSAVLEMTRQLAQRSAGAHAEQTRPEPRASSSRPKIHWMVYVAFIAAVGFLMYRLGQQQVSPASAERSTPSTQSTISAATPPPAQAQPSVAPRGRAVFTTGGVPAVFARYVGRGPFTVTHVARGMRHEYLALTDGAAPAHAVIEANAEWDTANSPALYELAMQIPPAPVPPLTFDALDLGVAFIPTLAAGAATEQGNVRVVTSPRGAKIYAVLSVADRLELTDLDPREPLELLVQADGTHVEKVVLGPSDWRTNSGTPTAEVTVSLRPR